MSENENKPATDEANDPDRVKRIKVVRTGGRVRLETSTPDGHLIVQDGKKDLGGVDAGMRPMELFLASLAGCTTMDVIHILGRMKHEPTKLEVAVEGYRRVEVPRIYEQIHLKFEVEGDVAPKNLLRAAHLSHDKYCSVSMMLRDEVKVTLEIYLNGELIEDTRES